MHITRPVSDRFTPSLLLISALFSGCASEVTSEDPGIKDALSAVCAASLPTSVTASNDDGNVPANVLDGNLATRWSSLGVGQFITADLGSATSVCGTQIAWYRGDQRVSSFTFSVSSDGKTFAQVFSGKSSGTSTALEAYGFSAVNARYLRVTVNGNTLNDWASITELKVGTAQTATAESLFGSRAPAATAASDADASAVELGVKLHPSVAGAVRSVRFYRATANAAGYTVHLWSATGTLLASATGKDGTLPGWQEIAFAAPVAVAAQTHYVASYFTSNGHYAGTNQGFASGLSSGHLSADANAGVYHYGTSAFPTDTYAASNYWVDVEFLATAASTQPTPDMGTVPPADMTSAPPADMSSPPSTDVANLHATTANLTSVFNGAKGGDVIALAAGNYGSFQGGSKGATVTLQPEPGAAVTMSVSFGTADHIKIDGFTLVGAELDNAHDIALVNCKFTDQLLIYAKVTSANILIDHDTFDGISVCTNCYEGRVQIIGDATPSGVTVSNSHFGSGGDSDGLQIGADGVQVGPGNEFDHIIQVNYTRHIDPLQFYGETHTFVTGNYFHDNSTGIMSPDGGKGERIENNVFDMSASGYAACACSHIPGLVVRHNTVIGASFRIDDTNNYQPGQPATTATVTDNLIEGGLSPLYYGTLVDDYNMIDSGKGSHDLAWAPHFTGGTHPNTRAGFRLVPGTAGTLKASDGTNISAIIPSCLPRAEDSAAKKPPMNGRRCAHSAAGRSLLVRRRDASRPCGKSSTTPALRKATGATPCCSKRCKTSRMRFVRLREPFSTADAESIEIHLVGDDLEVRFQDWEEQPVHLQFSETIAFRWDPCGGEDAPRDDEPYEVLESPWAARLVASRQAERCRHFKLCFNAASVLDVVSREIVVFRP